ncbi:type II toxin-antitoxin system Phd/YefM family antitoxin [Patescibacteria group bacterium]|nr:type II toxin-antitoxin system Phd/YefM family antitoxin [Patescibacteria group bacterium]
MLQDISMLNLRKKTGEIIDRTFYTKQRFLVKRKEKPMAMLIPIEDYNFYISDDNIELYSKARIKEFMAADKISPKVTTKAKKLLQS